MKSVDVRELAKLARMEVSDAELAKLEAEIPDILVFVAKLPDHGVLRHRRDGLRNIMREDGEPHESGLYTEKLMGAVPKVVGGRVAVKQVITRGK